MAARPPDWESYFYPRVPERTRELLEDFNVVGTIQHLVIVPRGEFLRDLRKNIRAAIVASTLHLRSIDYAKRRYCDDDDGNDDVGEAVEACISAYQAARAYVRRISRKLDTEGLPDPTVGVFGSALVLERLPPSFFCAHLLYRLGHSYEGHAVSRLILEQIAWAYAAHGIDDIETIANIQTTRAISQLKRFDPFAGQEMLTEYLFNTGKNQHFFCKRCGVRPFGVGNDTPMGKMYGVNIGCLEGVTEEELSKIPITCVDGMNDRWQERPEFFSHL